MQQNVLSLSEGSHAKRRFHFESFWVKLPVFLETVANSWNLSVNASGPLEQFSLKLKRLTKALQSMGDKQIGHVKSQLGVAREILRKIGGC